MALNANVDERTDETTKKVLASIGMRSSLQGYPYLLYSVEYIIHHRASNFRIYMGQLYHEVADKFSTKYSLAERSIRYAKMNPRCTTKVVEYLANLSNDFPLISEDMYSLSNSDFIYTVADIVEYTLKCDKF